MTMGMLLGPLLGGVVFAAGDGGYGGVYGMCWGLVAVDVVLRVVVVEKKVAKRWFVEDERGEAEQAANGTTDLECGNARHRDDKDAPPDARRTSRDEPSPDRVIQGEKSESPNQIEPNDPPAQHAPEDDRTTTPPSEPQPSPPTPRKRTLKLPPVISLLLSPRLLTALYASLISATLLTAFDSTLPLYVRALFNWDSTGGGLIFLPLVLPSFLSPLIGWLSDRHGPRWPAVCGLLLSIPFLVSLRFVTTDTLTQKVLLCVLLAGVGASFAVVLPPVMAEISYVVSDISVRRPGIFGERGAYAQGYGLFNMAFAGGMVAGPLWGGFVRERLGWAGMGWTLAVLAGGSAVPVGVATGGWVFSVRGRAWGGAVDVDDGRGGGRDGEGAGQASAAVGREEAARS